MVRMISRQPNITPLDVYNHAFENAARIREDAINCGQEDKTMSDMLLFSLDTPRLRVPSVAAVVAVAIAEVN